MSIEPEKSGYEAPTVTEESLDAGGNYVPLGDDVDLGTLGSGPLDPP